MLLTRYNIASRHALHYQEVLRLADTYFRQEDELGKRSSLQLELDWDQIKQAQLWASSHMNEDAVAAMLCGVFVDAGRVLSQYLTPTEIIQWVKDAEAAAQSPANRVHVWTSPYQRLVILGGAYADLNEWELAINAYKDAAKFAQETANYVGKSDLLNALGSAFRNLGQVKEAIEYQRQSLALARRIRYRRGEGNALNSLANGYLQDNQYRQAIDYYWQSIVVARDLKDKEGEITALCNLGNTYVIVKQYEYAIEYYNQALLITREIADERLEASVLNNIGSASNALGRLNQAMDFWYQAHAIFQRLGPIFIIAKIEQQISMIRSNERNSNFDTAISGDEQTSDEPFLIRLDASHDNLEWPDLNIPLVEHDRRLYGQLYERDVARLGLNWPDHKSLDDIFLVEEENRQHEMSMPTNFDNNHDEADEAMDLWIQSLQYYPDNLSLALERGEAALRNFEKTRHPDARAVRKLLSKWRKKANKKWWQFWR